ncbi:MAG TPA: branched-chain amino acid ABC transporter permease [Actinomycetota bacterium]|nr:branched-chain amino acid ABC transporter permease [Actinomycetota bacterium]
MDLIVIGVALGAVYGLVAVGIVLVYKSTRVLNFAQAELGTFGLYISWTLLQKNVNWLLAAIVAVAATTAVGVGFERLVIRPMGDASRVSLSVATAGLLLLLFAVELKIWRISPRTVDSPFKGDGISALGLSIDPPRLLALAALGVIAAGLAVLFTKTRFGLGILAVAEDAGTARLMGVPYARVSMFTWGLAGAVGGLAGLLIGPLQGVFAPLTLTGVLFVPGLTAALLGGLTALPGAFVGGIAVGVIETLLRRRFPTVPGIGSYGMLALILTILLARPRGLLGRAA